MVKKIISGGQTGADRAGLEVAREHGVPTGGTVPRGWRTEAGADPSLASFGCVEHRSADYRPRTRQNVKDADGTVWFGRTSSPGARLTIGEAKRQDKPILINPITIGEIRYWIGMFHIETLNVAGNRASTNAYVERQVRGILGEYLSEETEHAFVPDREDRMYCERCGASETDHRR